MILYLDITQLDTTRANTGIQRVVKELLKRTTTTQNITFKILSYSVEKESFEEIALSEIETFLKNPKNYIFQTKQPLDIKNLKVEKNTLYFDIDSPWIAPFQRDILYPILVQNGFTIVNFIYDLIPILLPHYIHSKTVKLFPSYCDALFKYSNLVFFDSISAQNDFIEYKKAKNITRNISLRTVHLGSDFFKTNTPIEDSNIQTILQTKYLLFVGTIEPRKQQGFVLEVFEELAQKHPELNLVFIGKQGWKVDDLIDKIEHHPLLGERFFWLSDIDDDTLNHFYQNAFIVTYLSKYEGYGLPIAESLSFGNVTIASKNSSMYEVGRDYADYVTYEAKNELLEILSLYLQNTALYQAKKEYIQKHFKTTSWDTTVKSMMNVFQNYEKSLFLAPKNISKLQFVFISISFENLQKTLHSLDKFVDFIEEYIIITAPSLLEKFKSLQANHPIILVDETTLLKEYVENFHTKDHQSKNWLLRASLLRLDRLKENFIMLDDDNQPLKKIDLTTFINQNGTYNCYYFYELLKWHHTSTAYDIGQQTMKDILVLKNYELYSYSSHAPQIINKHLFKEAVDEFFEIGLFAPIDEWSIYFNYCVSNYPRLFTKKIFQTLNWPLSPSDFAPLYTQEKILFENYYQETYEGKIFAQDDTLETKLAKKTVQQLPYTNTKNIFAKLKPYLQANNIVHGIASFQLQEAQLFLSSIPYLCIVEPPAILRLPLNYKILNQSKSTFAFEILILLEGEFRSKSETIQVTPTSYQESIIELPIIAGTLPKGSYNLTLEIQTKNQITKNSPYHLKLIVEEESQVHDIFYTKEEQIEPKKSQILKEKLKSIPLLGWFLRWSFNPRYNSSQNPKFFTPTFSR